MKKRILSVILATAIVLSCFVCFPVVASAYSTYEVSTTFGQNADSSHSVNQGFTVTNGTDGGDSDKIVSTTSSTTAAISAPAFYDGKNLSSYQWVVVIMRYEAYSNSQQNFNPKIGISSSTSISPNTTLPSTWVTLKGSTSNNGFNASLAYDYAYCSLSSLGATSGYINNVFIVPFNATSTRAGDTCWIDKIIFVNGSESDVKTVGEQNRDFNNYIVPNYRYGVRITNGVRYNGTGSPAVTSYSSYDTPELSPSDSASFTFSPNASSGGKLVYNSPTYVSDSSYTFSWSGSVSRNYYTLKGYYAFRYLAQGYSASRSSKYESEASKLTYKKWISASTTSTSISGEIDTYTELVLVPAWEPTNYTITYNLNGGTNNSSNPSSYNYESSSYTLKDPTRAGYKFTGWTPASSSYTTTINNSYMGNRTYTANWVADNINVTWYDENGTTVLHTDTITAGSKVPNYDGTTPTKAGNNQYSYTFSHWQALDGVAIGAVATSSVRFKAVYTSSVNKYTVIWKNEDGTTLETDEGVAYGATPEYNGSTPQKAGTDQYSYVFSGWTPTVSQVTGNVTYTATYTQKTNQYTITWKDGDGNIIHIDTVDYGATPSYDGPTPTKTSTDQLEYTFNGTWDPAFTTVTGNQIYTAQFDQSTRKYTVTWLDDDGTELEVDENVEYGAVPEYNGETPTKASDAQYTYIFFDWDPTVDIVTGDVTYTALYEAALNEYKITWTDDEGNVLETDPRVPYGTIPSYDGEIPTKEKPGYEYEFTGWSPEVEPVTGEAVYMAQFDETIAEYNLTYETDVGVTPAAVTYTINDSITIANLEQLGYIFEGWEVTTANGNWVESDFYSGGDVLEAGMYGDVTLTAIWTEEEITITYIAVGRGSVSPKYERNIGVVTGSTRGSTATATSTSKFIGWYRDEAGTDLVSLDEKFVPTKTSDNDGIDAVWTDATYYAIFEISITDLIIKVTGTDVSDNQSYIFDIFDALGNLIVTVAAHGDESVTIKDLEIGTYTVKEQNGWSWRYEPDEETKELTLVEDPSQNVAEFTETRQPDRIYWLDFNVSKENIFGKKENDTSDSAE